MYGAYAKRPPFKKFCDQFVSIDISLPLSLSDNDRNLKMQISQPIFSKKVNFMIDDFKMDEIFGFGNAQFHHYHPLLKFYLKHENILVFVGGISTFKKLKKAIDDIIWFDFNSLKWNKSKYCLKSNDVHNLTTITRNNSVDCIINDKIYSCHAHLEDMQLFYISLKSRRVDWKIERLVWIGYCKNTNNDKCLLVHLPKDIVKKILLLLACYPIFHS